MALIVGASLAAVVAWRLASGRSYSTNPPMAVSRKDDPLSFWLSLLFPAIFAVGLTAAGVIGLWHSFDSN